MLDDTLPVFIPMRTIDHPRAYINVNQICRIEYNVSKDRISAYTSDGNESYVWKDQDPLMFEFLDKLAHLQCD